MRLRQLFENTVSEVAIIFGRFNPPHKGHKAAWELASKSAVWYVGTNESTVGPKDPLPYDVKVEAMKTVWPKVEGHIVAETGWLTLASKVYKQYPDATLLCFTDEDWVTKTIQQYNGKEGQHGFYNFKNIEQKLTPRLSSATALRDAVTKGDRDAFSKAAGVDADTPVAGKPFFDLVAEYLLPYAELEKTIKNKVAKKKAAKEKEAQPSEGVAEGSHEDQIAKAAAYNERMSSKTPPIDLGLRELGNWAKVGAYGDPVKSAWLNIAKYGVRNNRFKNSVDKVMTAIGDFPDLGDDVYDMYDINQNEVDILSDAYETVYDQWEQLQGQQGVAERVRDPEDWDEGNTEPGNNFAVYINGKKWKVLPGPYGAYADSPEERREFYRLKDMAERKSRETGKKWEVSITGEPATR